MRGGGRARAACRPCRGSRRRSCRSRGACPAALVMLPPRRSRSRRSSRERHLLVVGDVLVAEHQHGVAVHAGFDRRDLAAASAAWQMSTPVTSPANTGWIGRIETAWASSSRQWAFYQYPFASRSRQPFPHCVSCNAGARGAGTAAATRRLLHQRRRRAKMCPAISNTVVGLSNHGWSVRPCFDRLSTEAAVAAGSFEPQRALWRVSHAHARLRPAFHELVKHPRRIAGRDPEV